MHLVHTVDEHLPHIPMVHETPEERLVRRQNEMLDQSAQFHLTNLFMNHTKDQSVDLDAMKIEFMKGLDRCKTVSDRYDLFMDDSYKDYIYTLDLGQTKRPGSHREVERLKKEYRTLRDRLVDNGVISGELTRRQAKPKVFIQPSDVENCDFVTRSRPLFSFYLDNRDITVQKRMHFLLQSSELDIKLEPGEPSIKNKKLLEELVDRQADIVIPVRTVYYAVSKAPKNEAPPILPS